MAGDHAAGVLALEHALDPGLEQIAEHRDDGDAGAKEAAEDRRAAEDLDVDRLADGGDRNAAEGASPGLAGRDRGPQARATDEIAGEQRAGVGCPDGDEHAADHPATV